MQISLAPRCAQLRSAGPRAQRLRATAASTTPAVTTQASMSAVVRPANPIAGQATGTSGLRKSTKEFMREGYLDNWVQSLFDALGPDAVLGSTLVLGGDGRYFAREAAQQILRVAAGNGVARVVVGKGAILSTPAASALIRSREADGGIIMSASHNPGGADGDFGIKYNVGPSGAPAPESVTDCIYEKTQSISAVRFACESTLPGDVDLDTLGVAVDADGFVVEVVDPTEQYVELMRSVFDFEAIRSLVARDDFSLKFDGMHAVSGPYAKRILIEELGASADSVINGVPLEDFGGGHPDPNLTYAAELTKLMLEGDSLPLAQGGDKTPSFGAASDGDGDRNMILGADFFVTPSDSVAVIAANAVESIPYFAGGLKGLARSMPTACALDRVASALGVPFHETPTGWKFFGNLMDSGQCSICGEESFGTGSDHVREKDGVWAVLCWLSVLAKANASTASMAPLVGVGDVVKAHWRTYGRNFFTRYDYEKVDTADAAALVTKVAGAMESARAGDVFESSGGERYALSFADDFSYTDPIDGSVATKQGQRLVFDDGSRIVFRLSGTGSSGATVRVYVERYVGADAGDDALLEEASEALAGLVEVALRVSGIAEGVLKREAPTVIT